MDRSHQGAKPSCPTCRGVGHHRPDCSALYNVPRRESACPDCGGEMRPIRLMGALAIEYLAFAEVDAKPSWISGAYPLSGILRAEICGGCQRVRWYGLSPVIEPETDRPGGLPIPAHPPEIPVDTLPLPASAPSVGDDEQQ